MAQVIVEGDKFEFVVVGKTKSGKVVPLTDATVDVDEALKGAVAVNADGTGGVFQSEVGKDGTGNLVATAAGVTSAPFPVDVQVDNVVTTVEIKAPTDLVVSIEPA